MTQETEKKATQTGETKETTKIRKEDDKSNKTENSKSMIFGEQKIKSSSRKRMETHILVHAWSTYRVK
jgi:hypothetical protein